MHNKILLVFHPADEIRSRLSAALRSAGARVMRAATADEARQRVESDLVPDALIAHLGAADSGAGDGAASWIGELLAQRGKSPIPVVVLADDRRQALRRGFVDVVAPPFDDEEVILVTRSSLARTDWARNLAGDLDKMPLPDLLQTAATNGQSGHVLIRGGDTRHGGGRTGEIWLRDGRVIDAELEAQGGQPALASLDALYELLTWQEGTFAVDFGPVSVPETIADSTPHLVLEAMRRLDERRRMEQPGHAGLPDEPPAPTREEKIAHLALLLPSVAASWVSDHLRPKVLAGRLEASRSEAASEHPALELFRVDPATGHPAYRPGADSLSAQASAALPAAVAAWLRTFFAKVERAIPGRCQPERLATLTEAHRDDLAELGFADALGWSPETLGNPTDTLSSASPSDSAPSKSPEILQ